MRFDSDNYQQNCEVKIAHFFKVLINCSICVYVLKTMSVVPQGAFAVKKFRQNEEKEKLISRYEQNDLSPTKYSSKYMNSIWGMYNRYSVHNLKKNMDEKAAGFVGQQKEFVGPKQSVDKGSTDFKGSLASSAKNILPSSSLLELLF